MGDWFTQQGIQTEDQQSQPKPAGAPLTPQPAGAKPVEAPPPNPQADVDWFAKNGIQTEGGGGSESKPTGLVNGIVEGVSAVPGMINTGAGLPDPQGLLTDLQGGHYVKAANDTLRAGPFGAAGRSVKGMYQNGVEQGGKAIDEVKRGNYGKAYMRTGAALVPGLGSVLDKTDAKDYSGAVGTGLVLGGLTAAGMYADPIASGIGKGFTAAGRYITKVNPRIAMMQGIRPRSTSVNFGKSLDRSMPEVKLSEQQTGRTIGEGTDADHPTKAMDDLIDMIKHAKQRVWNQYVQMAGPRANDLIDTTPVTYAVRNSIPRTLAFENPKAAQKIIVDAQKYRTKMTVTQIEGFLQEGNAKLAAYEAKYPAMKHDSLKSNPETAQLVAKMDALRHLLYTYLDSPGQGNAAREVKLNYGSLSELEENAMRRKVVAERQAPLSLPESMSRIEGVGKIIRGGVRLITGDRGGVGDVAAGAVSPQYAQWLKEQNNTNGLIRRAFRDYTGSPAPIQMPPPPLPPTPGQPTGPGPGGPGRGYPMPYMGPTPPPLPSGRPGAAPPPRGNVGVQYGPRPVQGGPASGQILSVGDQALEKILRPPTPPEHTNVFPKNQVESFARANKTTVPDAINRLKAAGWLIQ